MQQIMIDNEFSYVAPLASAVSQVQVLGLILFLLLISDIPEWSLKLPIVDFFADDSIIYREVHTDRDCTQLKGDMDTQERWKKTW